MISLREMTLTRGNKVLLDKASVSLHEKQKIGLVGRNGCGKSSLFGLLSGKLQPDHGDCQMNEQLRISHLSQQLPDSDTQALEFVLAGDDDYIRLKAQLTQAEETGDDATVLAIHEQLTQTGGYSKPAQAATIMAGLGFGSKEQLLPVNHFSGGWRMRLSLARCLMKPADLLLLDEPTNHLDMEAIFWLERWLKQVPCSIILISHDREFLDAFVSHILHIEHQGIALYTGNYSRFEQTRAEKLALVQASFEKQQNKIAHLMSFVNRFKAKASKAKQAQSRVKAIEKMELVAQAQADSPFSFEFYPCPRAGRPLLNCDKVNAGYSDYQIILKHINLALNPGDRIALLGPNGEGKSTLIKTLTGAVEPLSGTIERSANLAVGYYAQHQLEELDNRLSPLETIQALSPDAKEQTIRDYLGGFDFMGDMATHSIKNFSGGEKARLALAKLVWQKPNLLLLDEPTNHLDLSMRSAIEIALQSYEGALILISHDRHMLKSTVDDFYLVYGQRLTPFDGCLDDYYQWLQTKDSSKQKTNSDSKPIKPYKEKKALQNRLKKLEQMIEDSQSRLKILEHSLADTVLYEADRQAELDKLIIDREAAHNKLIETECEWMDVMTSLEEINAD